MVCVILTVVTTVQHVLATARPTTLIGNAVMASAETEKTVTIAHRIATGKRMVNQVGDIAVLEGQVSIAKKLVGWLMVTF